MLRHRYHDRLFSESQLSPIGRSTRTKLRHKTSYLGNLVTEPKRPGAHPHSAWRRNPVIWLGREEERNSWKRPSEEVCEYCWFHWLCTTLINICKQIICRFNYVHRSGLGWGPARTCRSSDVPVVESVCLGYPAVGNQRDDMSVTKLGMDLWPLAMHRHSRWKLREPQYRKFWH
jgi:hypothetical protein